MKRIKSILQCCILAGLLLGSYTPVYAGNVEFEQPYNFMVYPADANSIRFELLVWAYRSTGAYSHWADKGTMVYYSWTGNEKNLNEWFPLFEFYTTYDDGKAGKVYFKSCVDNDANNAFCSLEEGAQPFSGTNEHILKTFERTTIRKCQFMKINWFPSEKFTSGENANKPIHLKILVKDTREPAGSASKATWDRIYYYKSINLLQDNIPQLMDPVFAPVGSGPEDAGKVMIPFMSVDPVISYHSNQPGNQTIKFASNAQGGEIWEKTQDYAIGGYIGTFKVLRNGRDTVDKQTQAIAIPAYHEIHDFTVTRAANGSKKLSWVIKNAEQGDAVEGDMFEIQRAFYPDYNDAVNIGMVQMESNNYNDIMTYTFLDEDVLALNNPNKNSPYIYYRVRRASAGAWGWTGHNYAKAQTYEGRVKQIGLNDKNSQNLGYDTWCELNDSTAERVAIHGTFHWKEKKAREWTVMDPNVQLQVILTDTLAKEEYVVGVISANSMKWTTDSLQASFSFSAPLPKSCTTYSMQLKMVTDFLGADAPTITDYTFPNKKKNSAVIINNLQASKNDSIHPEFIRLTWEADGLADYFIIERNNDTLVANFQPETATSEGYWYNDSTAVPNEEYTYRVISIMNCAGIKTDTAECKGSRYRYGFIEGHITYTTGTRMAGVVVNLTTEDKQTNRTTTTDADGYYRFDTLAYDLKKVTSYLVTPSTQYADIYSYYNPEQKSIPVSLSTEHSVARNIDFLSSSYYRLTGRVLFSKTTIPVRDAYFLLSGNVVKSGADTIRTDASGNFSLTVPQGDGFTLQVAKEGHNFPNNGYLRINNSDTISLNQSLDGVRFWDKTRVRLVGRLAGGDIQGEKPLGFGESKNNLGDNLQLVLTLEGDNISHFVYDDKDLTKTTDSVVYKHYFKGQKTRVMMEEKRIIIYPDSATGEYEVELPPVKYRIVQASAQGYATLFTDGKTSETKDLTNSLIKKELKLPNTSYLDSCNDTYSVIYHAPAVVTVQQSRYSLPMAYFGEKSISRTTPNGTPIKVDLYDDQKETYTFGYPVFLVGMGYNMHISAKEEYRYNNVADAIPDIVPLGNYPVTVYNGLKNGTDIIRRNLTKDGTADVIVEVENISYSAVREEALKTLNVSVNINGQDVHAEPVQGFVLGSRLKNYDVMQTKQDTTPGAKLIIVNDILRDPPGSGSSAYLDQGATYTASYKLTFDFQIGLSLTKEVDDGGFNLTMGKYFGTWTEGVENGSLLIDQNFMTSKTKTTPIFSTKESGNFVWNWSYTHSLSQRVQTSSEASRSGMGPDANVYIGTTNNVYVARMENITVVDSMTLRTLQPSIKSGETNVLMKSKDGSFALITCEDIRPSMIRPVQFIYTQKHIVQHVIPTLVAEASKLIRTGTKEEVQVIADSIGEILYCVDDKEAVYRITPKNVDPVDRMENYVSLIDQWINILKWNERTELYGSYGMNLLNTYSISSGTTVSYSENNNANSSLTWAINGNQSADILQSSNVLETFTKEFKGGADASVVTKTLRQLLDIKHAKDQNFSEGKVDNELLSIEFKTSKTSTRLIFKPVFNITNNGSQTSQYASSRNTGFTLSQGKDGYLDIDVYRLTDSVRWNDTVSYWRSSATAMSMKDKSEIRSGSALAADFIYVVRGGATRCPYIGERRTEYYMPGTLLDNPTIRMEQVKMEIANREVSGVPGDGAAVFDVALWMETEASPGMNFGFGSATLSVSEDSNPDGAIVTMDGQPLTGAGRSLSFSRGKVLHKTIEVRRGTKSVDYNDIQLVLASDCESSNRVAIKIAAHFLPVSCNVNILTPDDKWVMNTYSPNDKDGYYLPVTIDGYDPNYDNFDHIEFQYKLSTQSESNWVNLCSYYMDSTLYLKANGNKAYVAPSVGRIENIHFYGERDPMEQRYDLRAVSFCRYGTGFITKASNVVSGIKDTRRPELFGVVSPANGVLTKEDYIRVPFSEPIAGNYLDEDNNFQVIGFKNKNDYFSRPSLYFGKDGYVESPVSRDLSKTNLTIDMVVLPDQGQTPQDATTYFVHGNSEHRLEFGQTRDNRLFVTIKNGKSKKNYVSDTIKSMLTFTRVAMVYERSVGNGQKDTIAFYVGSELKGRVGIEHPYVGNGTFGFGMDADGNRSFVGRMTDVRIWSRALTLAEIADTYQKVLTGSEKGLLVFYPMDEGRGKIIEDKAHGANAKLVNMSWNVPEGLALQLSGSPVELKPEWFNRGTMSDFTLSLWFKADEDSKNSLIFGNDNIKNDTSTANVAIMLDEKGQLIVKQNGTLTAGGNYADGEWHCLSVVVNRGLNSTQLFVDDKVMAREDGSFFRAWAFDRLYIGKNFYGIIDDISMWNLAMPENYLKSFYTHAPNGKEMGLTCYLPFSRRELNDNGVYETHFSRYNAVLHQDKTSHQWFEHLDTVVLSNVPKQMLTQSGAPVCKSNEYEKMNFSWVAQDNDLVINLKMPDVEINKQTIFFSLRDVEDLQGNRLLNPIVWSTYIDRNSLRWLESQVSFVVDYGNEKKFTIKADNQTGRRISYKLENMPNWLTSDVYINTVQPMGEEEFEFTISGELTPGDYFAMPTLTDDEGLSDQLFIFVTVNAPQPKWEMPLDLDQSMNLIGRVLLNTASIGGSYIDTDPRDIVGAFYGKTCIGKGNISSSPTAAANLYMKIYANQKLLETPMPITMRLWQASTGKTFTLKTEDGKDLQFEKDTVLGSAKKPIVFSMVERQVQNIPVTQGWNWLSFYVQPGEINASFITPNVFSDDEQIKVPLSKGGVAIYDSTNTKGWVYTPDTYNATPFNPMDYHLTYMYYRNEGKKNIVLEVEGGNISQDKRTVQLVRGWNYLPYLLDYNENIDAALSDYYDEASEGDFVNGYTRFAIFDGEHWMGTLQTLYAGEGYMLLRKAQDTVNITYFSSDVHSAPARISSHNEEEVRSRGNYATNMPIVAQVVADSATMIESLTAYANGQFAGEATPIVQADGSTLWFLSASAMEGSRLTFVVNEESEGKESSTTIPYAAFAPAGDLRNPLLIRFDDAPQKPEKVMINGILYIRRNGKIYTAQGALQNDEQIMNY